MSGDALARYLCALIDLTTEKERVRAADLSRAMGYSWASVSKALSQLTSLGYVSVDDEGFLSLKGEGLVIAERLREKRLFMQRMLESCGVPHGYAVKDAMELADAVSDGSFEYLKDSWLLAPDGTPRYAYRN